jgi:hypothetical protein
MTRINQLWTEAEIALLRDGWASGLSCAEIATRIPPRNAAGIAGMAHRLGLPVRGPGRVSKSKPRKALPATRPASRGTIIRDYVPAHITLAGPSWSHKGATK